MAGFRIRTPDRLPEEARRNPRKTGGPTHFRSRTQNSASLAPALTLFALRISQLLEIIKSALSLLISYTARLAQYIGPIQPTQRGGLRHHREA
jgi:hypothetical protein